jgi:hypothetical protein
MANIYRNITIYGLTDISGDKLMKTILANKPIFQDSQRVAGTKQAHQDAMGAATTYANFAKTHEVYINKARGYEATPYSIALSDWFGAPRVLEIDIDEWTGEIGQTIRVKARDNVQVAGVSLVIRDVQGNVGEMGEAVQSGAASPWWTYTTRSRVLMIHFPSIEAIARDLPINLDSFTI